MVKIFSDKFRALLPVFWAMLIMLIGSIVTLTIIQQKLLQNETRNRLVLLHQNFQRLVLEETTHMSSLLNFITENREFQKEWLEGDLDGLMQRSMPVFQRIKSQHNITHFYFITTDRKCALRLHNPTINGDFLDRTTLDMAAHLKRPTYGLELGPLGTFALRVVHPWIVDGRIIGYLELAEDVSHLSSQVAALMDVSIICLAEKGKLDRKSWEEGQRMLGKQADWNKFSDMVILSSDIENIPDKLTSIVNSSHTSDSIFSITISGKRYKGGFDQLSDAGGNYVARLVMLSETTRSWQIFIRYAAIMAFSGLGVIFILMSRLKKY
jgi:hypothetical protein